MKKTLWVVDDDREMAAAIELLLKLLDVRAETYPSARAAAQRLLKNALPDAIILDINMPEVSGIELLEFIRSKRKWRKLPVIMLSSEDADVQIAEAMQKGANAYLTKPVTLEELESTLKKIF